MPERLRTFIALQIAAKPFRDVLADLRDMGRPVRVASEPLHLTLKFLGETNVGAIREISQVIKAVADQTAALDLELRGLGAFPKRDRPSVVWVGVAPMEPVAALAEEFDARLEPLGVPRESRRFHPHVTLARIKARPPRELVDLFDLYADATFATVSVNEITWYESRSTPGGPEYSVLSTAALQRGAGGENCD